ncbi:hypothetical protein D3C76_1872060 [compost metagenome]
MRMLDAPTTFADSTKGSALSLMVSALMTLKYCGMNTTVMEIAAASTPPKRLDSPPLMTMAMTMATSRDGNA